MVSAPEARGGTGASGPRCGWMPSHLGLTTCGISGASAPTSVAGRAGCRRWGAQASQPPHRHPTGSGGSRVLYSHQDSSPTHPLPPQGHLSPGSGSHRVRGGARVREAPPAPRSAATGRQGPDPHSQESLRSSRACVVTPKPLPTWAPGRCWPSAVVHFRAVTEVHPHVPPHRLCGPEVWQSRAIHRARGGAPSVPRATPPPGDPRWVASPRFRADVNRCHQPRAGVLSQNRRKFR